ncbi:uncharacterized protein LOC111297435 [Durio zibethinus]|uniref:Uncharacterized protein LOC111297435 n=1 Tax=Durio zibethinus TaxID=66656 RepID=A0A6P5Z6C0_DURZI|nr:uncharacterized protein LOC111297435 [Durio zibethinus]
MTSPEFDVVPLKHYSEVPFFHFLNASPIIFRQSCNGLFLFEALDFHEDDERDDIARYSICNPTTKKFKILFVGRNPVKKGVSDKDYDFEIDIYSSETDSWTITGIGFEADEGSIVFEESYVFCNAKIHSDSFKNESLYFDVEKECLQKMPMPTLLDGSDIIDHMDRYFGEARGTLYIALAYNELGHLVLYVFEMATDYSNWFLKRLRDLGDAMRVFPEINLGCPPFYSYGYSVMCFIHSEKEEEPKVVLRADGKIICYDFNDVAWKMLYDPGPGVEIALTIQIFPVLLPGYTIKCIFLYKLYTL